MSWAPTRPQAHLHVPAAMQRRVVVSAARENPAGFKLASRCNSRRPKSRPAAVDPSSSAQDGAGNGQQRRADDMLKGELLSTLMQRRAMLADQQLPPLGWQQQAGTSQLASGDKGPLYAAAALQEQPPQQIGQLNGQPAPDASLPSPAAGGVPVADAAAAAPRKRGRPRKKAPSAASGSSLVSSSEGGGLAGSYGAAVALAAYEAALARSALATVAFCLDAKLEYGQRVRVVGGHEELGNWEVAEAPELLWTEGDKWQTAIELPAGAVVEYKYVVLDASGRSVLSWQAGANHVLAVRLTEEVVEIFDSWSCDPDRTLVVADGGPAVRRADRLPAWAGELHAQLSAQRQELRRAKLELAGSQEELQKAREAASFYRSQAAARESELHAEYGAREIELRAQHSARELELRAAAAAKEAERAEAASTLAEARGVNQALQAQLQETTEALTEAIETAGALLAEIEEGQAEELGSSGKDQRSGRRSGGGRKQ